jgi:hypothetical protein
MMLMSPLFHHFLFISILLSLAYFRGQEMK